MAVDNTQSNNASQTSRGYLIKTLGCKANLFDSQQIELELQKRGFRPVNSKQLDQADVCIVNSCTVTDEADRQSRKMAARLSRDNPSARVVVTGCSAEVDPEQLKNSKGVHYIIGNRDKPVLVDLILKKLETPNRSDLAGVQGEVLGATSGYEQMISRHPLDREWPLPERAIERVDGHTRAFLKIQDGCNSFCTYCVIPYGRGPSRSLKISEVVEQVRLLSSQGFKEVVITGINIGDYGTDWSEQPQVEELFEAVLAQTSIERLRVSSLDPSEITPRLLDVMKSNPRFCPHFHVSLQSPHPRILKLMKRKYSWTQVEHCLELISKIPAPLGGPFIGMDVITGFPGETEEEAQWTVDALKSLPWSRLHVFPYSERAGTPATRLPGIVPKQVRLDRSDRLRELSLERLKGIYQGVLEDCKNRHGSFLESPVLVESQIRGPDGNRDWVSGYTSNYLRIIFKADLAGTNQATLTNQWGKMRPHSIYVDSAAGDVALVGDQVVVVD